MNGWFPQINKNGDIASGNAGIWITPLSGPSVQKDTAGTSPIWADSTLIYNRNNGQTQVGFNIINQAYNSYEGSDDGRWAGFTGGAGRTDVYNQSVLQYSADTICNPRFANGQFGYLAPYQSIVRNLVINNVVIANGEIIDFQLSDNPNNWIYNRATGTYTKELVTAEGTVQLRSDETIIKAFTFNNIPWMLSGTGLPGGVTFVRPYYDYMGYAIYGILMYPDCRIINNMLLVAGSDDKGNPLFNIWIDFNNPRVDLRTINGIPVPPDPVPPDPIPPIPPDPIPPKPKPDFPTRMKFHG